MGIYVSPTGPPNKYKTGRFSKPNSNLVIFNQGSHQVLRGKSKRENRRWSCTEASGELQPIDVLFKAYQMGKTMKLTHLTLVALSVSLTQAAATTVNEAGYGFKYTVLTNGDPTGSTTVGMGGFPGSESEEVGTSISVLATGLETRTYSGDTEPTRTPHYAEVRGDLTKGEIGAATGYFEGGASVPQDEIAFTNTERSDGIAEISMHELIRVDLSDESEETSVSIGFGANLEGEFGDSYDLRHLVSFGVYDIVGGHFIGNAGNNHQARIDTRFWSFDADAPAYVESSERGLVDSSNPYAPRGTIELSGGYIYDLDVFQLLKVDGKTSFLGTASFFLDTDQEFTSQSGKFLSANTVSDSLVDEASTDSVSTVPVPAAGWLMVMGLAGLGALKRRKSPDVI